tara:strand:+ start:296 stop:487 length:192 start_codon:yes stop_codon:yes gene_type:complete
MSKARELRELSQQDLKSKLESNLVKLLDYRLQLRQGKSIKTHMIGMLRRENARIKTILTKRVC